MNASRSGSACAATRGMPACRDVPPTSREWQPRQPHPGTRVACCCCFLPDLAEFTSYRREGTDEATIRLLQASSRCRHQQTPSGMYSAHPVPRPPGSLRCTHGHPAHVSNPSCQFAGSNPALPRIDQGCAEVRYVETTNLAERAGCTRHILCLALRAACAAPMGILPMCRTRHVNSRVQIPLFLASIKVALKCVTSRPQIWRRERDSNPRSGVKPLTHFPGVLLQPLGHLSSNRRSRSSMTHVPTGGGGY